MGKFAFGAPRKFWALPAEGKRMSSSGLEQRDPDASSRGLGVAEPPGLPQPSAPLPAAESPGMYALLPWLVLALFAAFLLALGPSIVFPDTWFGLDAGRDLVAHGFSQANTWTRWGSREWVDQQWGAHLLTYGVWRVAGAFGVVALNIGVILAGLALCVRAAMRRGGGAGWTSLVLVVVLVTANSDLWYSRAQSFSVLCFGLLFLILTRDEGRLGRGVFLTIPLLAVWANLHAAVFVGAGICVVYAVVSLIEPERQDGPPLHRRALALMLASGLACLATPVVTGLPWYLRQTLHNPDFAKYLPEWVPTTLMTSPFYVLGAFAAVAITVLVPLARRDRALVVLLTIAGFTAYRSELWGCLIWLVVLPGALERLRPVTPGRRLRRTAIGLAVLSGLLVAGAAVNDVVNAQGTFARAWPRSAADLVTRQLRADPGLRVFADQPLSDWLLYDAPAVRGRLAIDGRFESFDHRTFLEVDGLSADPVRIAPRVAAENLYVLAPASYYDGRLIRALEREPGIVRLYSSKIVVILRRTSSLGR
jgi:hypothetical protein